MVTKAKEAGLIRSSWKQNFLFHDVFMFTFF